MHLICIHYRPTLSGPYACSRYKHKSPEISFGHDVYHLNSDFEILYRARQYHCRALYKIWKWFSGLKLHQGRTSFHEICVSVVSCVLWIRLITLLIYVWTRSWVVSLNRCQVTERFCHPLHYIRWKDSLIQQMPIVLTMNPRLKWQNNTEDNSKSTFSK